MLDKIEGSVSDILKFNILHIISCKSVISDVIKFKKNKYLLCQTGETI